MCPGCVGSALLLLSGASSAGGLAAFKLKLLRRVKAIIERIGSTAQSGRHQDNLVGVPGRQGEIDPRRSMRHISAC
jgi:hypothetical protein